VQIPFVGGAYQARSTNLNAQRCINFYAEKDESGTGKNVAALIGTPGLRLLATLGGLGGLRALWTPTTGNMIAVQGASVYSVSSSWAATLLGTITTTTGPVSIADNGITAVLVDGSTNGYTVTLATSVFAQITDPDFLGADRVDYIDDLFVFNRLDTGQFYISGFGNTVFDGLDFASAEGSPDVIVSFIVDHRQLVIFGTESGELFENTGNRDFPLERAGNVFIEQGCAAKFGIAKIDNTVFWLGSGKTGNGIIWRLDGARPVRISTHAIEYAIQNYSTLADCVAYAYQQEGHSFVSFNFPTASKTWVFDASTGLWHERAWLNPATGTLGRHRSCCHAFFNNTHVVGDWENGKLYALDLDYFSDNGDAMPSIRAAAHISDGDYGRIRFDRLQIDFEAGTGTQTGQGVDPQAMLDWSDDGGKTWSSQHWRPIGRVGKYKNRARWKRLGQAATRAYRVTITDPVRRVIIGASSKAVGLTS
jgi:hypothetical protein